MADVLTVRTATLADQPEVDSLLARSYPALLKADYAPSILVTAVPLIARAQPRLLASGTYYVVEGAGAILGAGGWTAAAPGNGARTAATGHPGTGHQGTGHVRHVVTDHRRVRQGVGRALMAHVVLTARIAGVGRLECLSTLTAVPFYAALGFRTLGPATVPLRPGIVFPAVAMVRDL